MFRSYRCEESPCTDPLQTRKGTFIKWHLMYMNCKFVQLQIVIHFQHFCSAVHLFSIELDVLWDAWGSYNDGAWRLCSMNTSALLLRKQECQIRGLWSCLMHLASSMVLCHFRIQGTSSLYITCNNSILTFLVCHYRSSGSTL